MPALQTQGSGKETETSTDFLLTKVSTLRELIDGRAEASAEASYLVSPETGRVVTYRGLQQQARAIAARLRELGLAAGDKVAFLMDNGLFTAELFLGAMYGGFVSVPLNVRAGVSQLAYMVEHCDARVVFVADEYAALMSEVLPQVGRPVRVISADVDEVSAVDEATVPEPPLAVLGPEDTALLMYTSGSTGHPKAAVHTHRTLLAHGRNSVCSHQLTASDRSLLVLPLYHINAECVTLIPTLLSGGSVVVPHRFSISHYWDWLRTVVELLSDMKRFVPRWHRIMRIQREIPAGEISGGVKNGNLRELVLARAEEKGWRCGCIRCREVALNQPAAMDEEDALGYQEERYSASGGLEVFGSFEYKDSGKIAGFVRLRVPSENAHRPEMAGSAVVRELRVYGRQVEVGGRNKNAWQHRGLGASLMESAEKLSCEEFDAKRVLVTSAVGTRNYYRKLGYERLGPYMAKRLG